MMGITKQAGAKFDFITFSRTKKFRITVIVVLALGILLLLLGILLRSFVTDAVLPNDLKIVDGTLSNYDGRSTCIISTDQPFVLSTSTPENRALIEPINFSCDAVANQFLEVTDKDGNTITSSHYQGLFYLHIKDDAPATINGDKPTGYLTITCGSKILKIKFVYEKV